MGLTLRSWSAVVLALAPAAIGCAASPVNPSFSVSTDEARRDLARIADAPRPLDRPLVIVTGFLDPGLGALLLRMRFDAMTHDPRVIAVSLGTCLSFEGCRQRVIDDVDREFPSHDPGETTEVDVLGYSLGGLVARYAALPTGSDGGGRRLRVARLFTISSPHTGADDARRIPLLLHPLQRHLRSGSDLLRRVNEGEPPYPVFAYVRLGDGPVGAANAAPPGRVAWWVPTPAFSDPHNGAFADERILADILRRLRGEAPFSHEPPAPLPVE